MHCGNSKENWFDENLLISPLDSNCETKFIYTGDGHIKPSVVNDNSAKTTINKLKLDIDKLVDLRNKAIEPFIIDPITHEEISLDDAKSFAKKYIIEKDKNDGKYNEFFTTIKYLFGN